MVDAQTRLARAAEELRAMRDALAAARGHAEQYWSEIAYIGDSTALKEGLLTPGTHIPVVDEEKIFKDQPEYALLLSWHIGEELMRIYRKIGYKGKFIMPLPEAKIID